jgi:hypothetical protein
MLIRHPASAAGVAQCVGLFVDEASAVSTFAAVVPSELMIATAGASTIGCSKRLVVSHH